jgi:HSP20 family protein
MNEATTLSSSRSIRPVQPESGPLNWLRGEIDRLFDGFGLALSRNLFDFPARFDMPTPVLELVDDGDCYRLSAELPGLKEDDINVEYRDRKLILSGEKKEEKQRKDNGYLLNERRYGSFRRELTLPSDVDDRGIEATFKDGILTMTMKKNENSNDKPRKIKIG